MNLKEGIKKIAVKLVNKKVGPVAITLHHIPEVNFVWLQEFLDGLLEDYEFINPADMTSKRNLTSNKILLTFDDGLLSQKRCVEKILDPMKIKALFFIPTGFVGMRGSRALQFAKTRLFPFSSPQDLSDGAYDAMSWEDIVSLAHSGHCIGSHTDTHPELSFLTYQEQYHEIVNSADLLSDKLSIPIQQFAYPFGSMETVNKDSVKIAQARFQVSYSNIRGMLYEQVASNFLFRQNIVPGMPLWMARAAVDGRMDWWHYRARGNAHWSTLM